MEKIREELVDLKCELGPSFLLQVVVALSSMSTKEQVHHIFLEGTADELFYNLIMTFKTLPYLSFFKRE